MIFNLPLCLCAQTDVPVYPNATLNTEHDPGEEPACCDFITTDPVQKVNAFYEQILGTKPLTPDEMAAKYPSMKDQITQMKKNIPAGVRYYAFVLSETGYDGSPYPEILTIVSANGKTTVSIAENQLGESGSRYAYEFRKATGTLDNNDQAFESWAESHPPARQDEFEFPLYPGSLVAEESADDSASVAAAANQHGKCYDISLYVLDSTAFDKVVAFYKKNLGPEFKIVGVPDPSSQTFETQEIEYYWSQPVEGLQDFHGKPGDANRDIMVLMGTVPGFPYFSRDQRGRVAGNPTPCVIVRVTRSVLGDCEQLPKETRRKFVNEEQ